MLRALGVDRGALVQPSVYMSDNTALHDALDEADFPLRGVAVIGADVKDSELEHMHRAGAGLASLRRWAGICSSTSTPKTSSARGP